MEKKNINEPQSLIQLYSKLFKDSNYYSGLNINKDIAKILESNDEADNFIRQYFSAGNKSYVLNNIPNMARAIHSVSTFLLGVAIAPLLKINMLQNNKLFLRLWFLTCLYHDSGYYIENNSKAVSLTRLLQEQGIKHNVLKSKRSVLNNNEVSLIKRYYTYIGKRFGKIDHGIIGGLKLYSYLVSNYNDCWKEHKCNAGKSDKYSDFTYNGLKFSIKHFEDFARCSSAIMQHNIWFAYKNEDIAIYRGKLDELILENGNKHCYSDSLTALLVLCDTMEPTKRFCCKPINTLNNIGLSVDKSNGIITIKILSQCMEVKYYIDNLREMSRWTNCKVEQCDSSIVIDIHNMINNSKI